MKRIFFVSLAILFLCSVAVNAADIKNEKIAVASSGKTLKASVSNKAAKCPYFLMFDSKGGLIEVIDNPYGDASGGAGPSAANFLSQKGVTIVIAGKFGSKMINTLKSNGITHFEFKGSVDDAVKRVLE
jgi:predicted Fe-Mo cluster-binding NifX family protein